MRKKLTHSKFWPLAAQFRIVCVWSPAKYSFRQHMHFEFCGKTVSEPAHTWYVWWRSAMVSANAEWRFVTLHMGMVSKILRQEAGREGFHNNRAEQTSPPREFQFHCPPVSIPSATEMNLSYQDSRDDNGTARIRNIWQKVSANLLGPDVHPQMVPVNDD